MKRSVENWYYNLKLNENWRSYATLKLSYLKIMEVAISTRLETAVMQCICQAAPDFFAFLCWVGSN